MKHDETLLKVAEKVKNFAVICTLMFPSPLDELSTHQSPPADTVDITQVPDFNKVRSTVSSHKGSSGTLTCRPSADVRAVRRVYHHVRFRGFSSLPFC